MAEIPPKGVDKNLILGFRFRGIGEWGRKSPEYGWQANVFGARHSVLGSEDGLTGLLAL